MDDKKLALQLIPLIDHTNLNPNASTAEIETLCRQAVTPHASVAAVCICPQYIQQAKKLLQHTTVHVATVCNFPAGDFEINHTLKEITQAMEQGADEIDVVLPYVALSQGKVAYVSDYLNQCRAACGNSVILKVILETGYLSTIELITQATTLAIASGADFIKTSTGKIKPGATLESVSAIIKVIAAQQKKVGIKISGGIQTLVQIKPIYQLIVTSLGINWIDSSHIRIGSSSLLIDLKQIANSIK